MNEIISLDELTELSVSVVKRQYIEVEGIKYNIGNPHRTAYVNSISGRVDVASELPEPYLSAVMAMWGVSPLVPEPPENNKGDEI